MENKTCSKCKELKSIDQFHYSNRSENKRQSSCKDCVQTVRKASYQKNAKHHYLVSRERKAKLKEHYIAFKATLSCERCGENHPQCLEFHHKDPTQKEFLISSYFNVSFERFKKEIEKCIVLCANCHRKLHFNEAVDKVPDMDQE